jgi:hypothetical protein
VLLIKLLILVVFTIVTTVSAWITALRMRRRIRRSLGRKASDAELISINTWMKVNEAEQRNEETKPINPS